MAKEKFHNIVKSKGFKLAIGLSASVLAIGATCGLAVGLCATSNTEYIDIDPLDKERGNRLWFADENTKQCTTWNVPDTEEPLASNLTMRNVGVCFAKFDYNKEPADQFAYVEMVGNGPDTSILDKSFQQSAYYAQTYWAHAYDKALPGGEGTGWMYDNPAFDYEKFPLDDLALTTSNKITLGQMSSSAQKPSGASNTDFVNTYKAAYDIGKKALTLPGYQHITPLTILKQNDPNVYNSMGYILVDSEVPDPNIASMQFKAEQSAFLSGVAACQYLQENWQDVYSKVNGGQLAVGCFGGQNIITVTCFMGGLELGVWFYNNYILPNTDYYKNASQEEKEKRTVKFISLGKQSSYFSGTFVIGDAKLLAQELLAKGACVVMAVAGPQTGDVVSEIVAQRSPCRVLGVDSAMENGDWGKYMSTSDLLKPNTKVLLCSAEKNVAQLTAQILDNMWCRNRGTCLIEQVEENKSSYDDIDKSTQFLFNTVGQAAEGKITYTVKYGADETSAVDVPAAHIESDGVWTVTAPNVPLDLDYVWINAKDEQQHEWNTSFQIDKSKEVPGDPAGNTIHCQVVSRNTKHENMLKIDNGGKLNFIPNSGKKISELSEDEKMSAVGTIGYTSIGNLYNNGVKLSDAGQEYLIRALNHIDTDGTWSAIDSYEMAVKVIINSDLPAITTLDGQHVAEMNVLDFIRENTYFQY